MPNDPVFWANESLRVAFDQRDLDAFDGDTRAKYSVPLYTKPPDQAEIGREQRIMKVAHTPGPWFVGKLTANVYFGNSSGELIAQCGGYKFKQKPEHEEKANAHLIAAAPDLLEAAIALQVAAPLGQSEWNAAADKLDKAISKATGVSSDQR